MTAGIIAVGFLVVMVVFVIRGTRGGGSRQDGGRDYETNDDRETSGDGGAGGRD